MLSSTVSSRTDYKHSRHGKTGALTEQALDGTVKLIKEQEAAMDDLSEQDLEEIEQRCLAATPGPWKLFVEGRDCQSGSSFIQTDGEDIYLSGATVADQDFIASARQDIPRWIAEISALWGKSRL